MDETSVGRHFYERRPWARLGDNEESPIIGKYASAQSLQSSAASTVEPEGSVDDQKTSPDNSDAELEDQKEVAADDNQHQTQDIQDQSSESEEEEFPDTQLDISTDKYNLSGLQDALTDSYHPTGSEARKGPVKHISAKQRRDMKKGKPSGTALPVQSEGSVSPKPADGDDDGQPPTKATPLPRGKKGKMKKMKDKYKDQDDEDRERILDFLGAAQGPQPKGKKAKAAAAKKAQSDEYKARREQEYEEKEQKASRKENSTKEQAEIQRMLEEENVALPDEEQMADLTYLDSLTGEPHSADILLNAVPVCAPWNTLGKYKYRVKLTPGGLKKGKAAKAVMSSFLHTASKSEETKRELELIKGLQDNEVIQQILGKVKVLGTSDDKKKGKK